MVKKKKKVFASLCLFFFTGIDASSNTHYNSWTALLFTGLTYSRSWILSFHAFAAVSPSGERLSKEVYERKIRFFGQEQLELCRKFQSKI